jgi:hypothetical protein
VPIRASQLWKDLSPEKRVAAADALWRDGEAMEQQVEAIVLLARRLNFRAKSVQTLPVEQRARHLARVPDVSDSLAARALVAYHFTSQRPLMAAFLDALGVAHEEGLITNEELPAPGAPELSAAIAKVRSGFPDDAVDLYLRTLVALDPDTWTNLDALLPATP